MKFVKALFFVLIAALIVCADWALENTKHLAGEWVIIALILALSSCAIGGAIWVIMENVFKNKR